MSRRGGPRSSADDLAYGDIPQRWDRDRFERLSAPRSSRHEEDDYRFVERDRGGRQDVTVMEREREQSRGPRGRFEEQTRFYEEERRAPSRPRRRTDRELFGDVDPRELANLALTPYQPQAVPKPGLIRRQSSLDTFDRRPIPRYEREEHRIPVYTAVPVPYRRPGRYDEFEEVRYRDYEPEDYRDVEIRRERSVHRNRSKGRKSKSGKSSKAKSRRSVSTSSSSSSSSSETIEESVHESGHKSTASKSAHGSAHKSSANKTVHETFHETIHETPSGRSVHESFHESVHDSGSKAPSSHTSVRSPKSTAKSVHKSIHESIRESEHDDHESFHESIHESEHDDHQSFHESIHESIQETDKKFKKGKTRMPKRLVRREAIMDLGYPFDEEEDFFVLRIALEKEQIDEVIQISESYKSGEKKVVYRFDETVDQGSPATGEREREEVLRTEWINPPSVVGRSRSRHTSRPESPGGRSTATRRTGRSRAVSGGDEVFEERKTVIEERSIPPPPIAPFAPPPPGTEFFEEKKTTILEERSPSHARAPSTAHVRSPSHAHSGALVVAEREYRSDRDIQAEIHALEAERRAVRLEREADERRQLALRLRERPAEGSLDLVEFSERRPREYIELEREEPRTTLRVEKDKKDRRARKIAAAMATLT